MRSLKTAGCWIVVMLLGACAPRGEAPLSLELRAVVDRFEAALAAGDDAAAAAEVKLEARLAEVLGPVWADGDAAARAALVAVTRASMMQTSEAYRGRWAGMPMKRRVLKRAGADVWVESVPQGDAAEGFGWRYRLTREGTTWAITRRDIQVAGQPVDSTRFWRGALKQLASQLGRMPTLAEVVAAMPELEGTVQVRRFRVPE